MLLSSTYNEVLPPDFHPKTEEQIRDLNDRCKERPLQALQLKGELPESTLDAILMLFEHQQEQPRWSGCGTLTRESDTLQPELARTLNDVNINTAKAVADALCSQSKLDDKTWDTIMDIAKGSKYGRKNAMLVLRNHSPLDPNFLQVIVNLMGDKNWDVKRDALYILGADKSLPEDILLIVAAMIGDEDSDVKQTAYHALVRQ
ncbi:hypothetical protein FPOAC1_004149 [Fusarium poae]|uniref:hypothetical protein n=1 Tax=Fusarium poae TaxID=36050 RepID=UPI001CE8C860|nr:hypothetical protein FPOAC1_004149 [Fusarium poae]KAG8670914.1 hypothetical protein FPOAC1_004149 [Fusarium poae]